MKRAALLVAIMFILAVSGCIAQEAIISKVMESLPEGAYTVSSLVKDPVYNQDVVVVGKVSELGELLCPCFTLTFEEKSIEVWHGLMVEEGSGWPDVSTSKIKNGDFAVVYGQLKEGNKFWAKKIENAGNIVSDALVFCTAGTGEKMSLVEAKYTAMASECGDRLKDTYFCNENTGTWWIDLDIEKELCNPACVVNVVTKQAEINWRCTGLVP